MADESQISISSIRSVIGIYELQCYITLGNRGIYNNLYKLIHISVRNHLHKIIVQFILFLNQLALVPYMPTLPSMDEYSFLLLPHCFQSEGGTSPRIFTISHKYIWFCDKI